MIRFTATLALLFLVLASAAQKTGITLNGKVTDKESGQSLSGISVYINNTTFSTQTDKNGGFKLENIPLTTVELTFSAINYQMEVLKLNEKDILTNLDIRLGKNTTTLTEVVIAAQAGKNGWDLYGSTFRTDFLSYSPFSKKCDILNPQVIKFTNDKKSNILKAHAKEPLKIRNKALGYDITYWLEEYEHRFGQELVLFKGFTQFAEMNGNQKQKEQWQKNRETAYNGSLAHFLKAVYDNKTADEGFIVNLIKPVSFKDLKLYIPAATDSIDMDNTKQLFAFVEQLYQNEDSTKNFLKKLSKWDNSLVQNEPLVALVHLPGGGYNACFFIKNPANTKQALIYMYKINDLQQLSLIDWMNAGAIIPDENEIARIKSRQGLSPEQKNGMKVMLFYSKPLQTQDFVLVKDGAAHLKFTDSWQVTYTRERTEKEYIKATSFENKNAAWQQSVLSMGTAQPVVIMPNGYYTDTYSLVKGAYWSYEKTDKLLPFDYVDK